MSAVSGAIALIKSLIDSRHPETWLKSGIDVSSLE